MHSFIQDKYLHRGPFGRQGTSQGASTTKMFAHRCEPSSSRENVLNRVFLFDRFYWLAKLLHTIICVQKLTSVDCCIRVVDNKWETWFDGLFSVHAPHSTYMLYIEACVSGGRDVQK